MFWETVNSAGRLVGAASSSGTAEQTMSDVIDSATEVTAEAGEEVNQFIQFFQDNLPNIHLECGWCWRSSSSLSAER